MIEDLYKKRYQVYRYTDEIPDETMVKNIINKTYELTASKQGLVPYRVYILGPNCKEEKKKIFNKVCVLTDKGTHQHNIKAPYNLIFTIRLVDNPNQHVKNLIKKGNVYVCTESKLYKKEKHNVSLEIGMFAKVLTGLCMENNLGVSYQLCFHNWVHENEEVLFSMQFGYPATKRLENRDFKPNIDEVIKWK